MPPLVSDLDLEIKEARHSLEDCKIGGKDGNLGILADWDDVEAETIEGVVAGVGADDVEVKLFVDDTVLVKSLNSALTTV